MLFSLGWCIIWKENDEGISLSKGFRISERNVATALKAVDPDSYESR